MPGSGMLRNVPATAAAWYLSKTAEAAGKEKGGPKKEQQRSTAVGGLK